MATIGTCSHCGGPVQVPELWGGRIPPTPTCIRCGAEAKAPYGQVIQTERHETTDEAYNRWLDKRIKEIFGRASDAKP